MTRTDSSGAVPTPDPFGVDALRVAVLESWRSSPTRLREDAAAEYDLSTLGYRDRLCTELVANAADAAEVAEVPGAVLAWADGTRIHLANIGAPLTVEGAASLLALRVSPKREGVVGRFGVGFSAVAAVADRVEVRSITGSLVFDRDRTAEAIAEADVDTSEVIDQPAPLLRLAWPTPNRPREGFDTEIVLSVGAAEEAAAILAALQTQAPDLLLELPALARIEADGAEFIRDATDIADMVQRITIHRREEGHSVECAWLQASRTGTRWLVVERDGAIVPGRGDLLRAPTPTDIALTLPARCITGLPLTPDRRQLHPDADIADAAAGYVELVRATAVAQRLDLVPAPAGAAGMPDLRLSEAVLDELRTNAWLPAAVADPAEQSDLIPSRAVVLVGLTDDLAALIGDLFADLVHPDLCAPGRLGELTRVGVQELGLAEFADRLAGVRRPASWWSQLYAALAPLVSTPREVAELASIPVPRADGRLAIGVRGLHSAGAVRSALRWLPTVAPEAQHPLLDRLGLERISVSDALADPALQAMVEDLLDDPQVDDPQVDDPNGVDGSLADEVLALIAADPQASVPTWLAGLPLRAADGDHRPADELLLPGAPLLDILVDDHPFGIVAADLVDRVGVMALRRLGVGWGFTLLHSEYPVGPEHDLPDEEQWWATITEAPEEFVAIRDLDLVADERWSQALSLLVAEEDTAAALEPRWGYTAWWLRTFATIDGHQLGWYRAPSDDDARGVRDPLDHPEADRLASALGGVAVDSPDNAVDLLARLADSGRIVSPGVAGTVYSAVASAMRDGTLDAADIPVPELVRAASGTAVADAVVLDDPQFVQVLPAAAMVVPAHLGDADLVAEVLDRLTASEAYVAVVEGAGVPADRAGTEAVLLSAATGWAAPVGEVRVHDDLRIQLVRREGRAHEEVPEVRSAASGIDWWVDENGVTHLHRPSFARGDSIGRDL